MPIDAVGSGPVLDVQPAEKNYVLRWQDMRFKDAELQHATFQFVALDDAAHFIEMPEGTWY